MNHKRLLPQMTRLTLVLLFLVACGTSQPTPTPVLPTATPTPTRTRTPAPTPTREPQAGATKELGQTGITLVYVPAGEFLMGSTDSDPDAESNEKPQHLVYLDGYWIGKTEVTNAQYRKFVEDGGYSKAEYWSEEGWQWKESNGITEPAYWTDPAWNGADYPVVGVSWYEASAYARWAGARLPTEAEWEKAARGTDGRVYPWGNEWDDSRVNASGASTSPVGHYSPRGDSPYGVADMVGNVWEWTLSLWGRDWREPEFRYPYDATDGRENVKAGEWVLRVVRGESFGSFRGFARCSYRSWWLPGGQWDGLGFRVVVSPS
jgi:formylglycine-generating enzyme required for sulfatase activity